MNVWAEAYIDRCPDITRQVHVLSTVRVVVFVVVPVVLERLAAGDVLPALRVVVDDLAVLRAEAIQDERQ